MTAPAPALPTPALVGHEGNWNRLREPRQGICLHYDASASDPGAVAWLTRDPRCQVSYNWLVLDDGKLVLVAPPEARAWHAGVCRPSSDRFTYRDANSALYGVAIAATVGQVVTDAQLHTVVSLCRSLFQRNRWPVTDDWRITSHRAEAWPRGRKVDCEGPDLAHPVLDPATVRRLLSAPAGR